MRDPTLSLGCSALLLMAQLLSRSPVEAEPAKPTVCPPRPGYYALADTDHKGDDIGKYGKDAVRKCDTDANCAGFTGSGIGKRNLLPTIKVKGKCLYVKVPAICLDMGSQFTVFPDLDCAGNIEQVELDETSSYMAMITCLQNVNCTAFTAAGMTKNCTGPLLASRGTCLYVHKPTPCPEFPGFTMTQDVEHKGDDIAEYGHLAAAKCLADPACKGFSSYGTGKAAVTPTRLNRFDAICLYTKIAVNECASIPGYTAIPNVENYGTDLRRVNPSLGPSACDNDTGCVGFNNNGELKHCTAPLHIAFGSCFYIKVPTVCRHLPGFTAFPDVDVLGKTEWTLPSPDDFGELEELAMRCGSCRAFNSKNEMKSSARPMVPSRGTCLYVNDAPEEKVCRPIAGYSVVMDASVQDNEHERYVYDGSAGVACSADPACKTFDSNGRLTETADVFHNVHTGACIYIKD